MRIIKHLNTGEIKMECTSCLNRYRAASIDFKCPLCEALKKVEITEPLVGITKNIVIIDGKEITYDLIRHESPVKILPFIIVEEAPIANQPPEQEQKKKKSKKLKGT